MLRGFFLYLSPSATASATAKKAEVFLPTATASATAKNITYGRPLLLLSYHSRKKSGMINLRILE